MVLHAAQVRLPHFNADLHKALRAAGIDLFRIPASSESETELRVELDASDERDARSRIRAAVGPGVARFVFEPYATGGKRWGDGTPEHERGGY
jgi:hypothetical protein